jgi:hypothetical protein
MGNLMLRTILLIIMTSNVQPTTIVITNGQQNLIFVGKKNAQNSNTGFNDVVADAVAVGVQMDCKSVVEARASDAC